MTVLSSPTVKLNKRAKIMLSLVVTFFTIPLLVLVIMVIQGFVEDAGEKDPQEVVATRVSSSAATIAWVTTGKVSATVEYGTTPGSLQTYAPEVTATKEHEIDLTLLSPATTYYYQIRMNGNKYDNSGVPWTFTTKTISGEEVAAAVKGATTKLSVAPSASPTPAFGTDNCEVTECSEIKARLGKGCGASDYIQCISTASPSSVLSSYTITLNPTPTQILIDSEACRLKGLRTRNHNCASWEWQSMSVNNPKICRDAFDRYILYCRDKEWGESIEADDFEGTYAIGDIDTISKTLPITPTPGKTIYCRLRAVDIDGTDDREKHATPWINTNYQCNY